MKTAMKYSASTQSYGATFSKQGPAVGGKAGKTRAGFSDHFISGAPFGDNEFSDPVRKKKKTKS